MGDFDAMDMLAGRTGPGARLVGGGVGANRPLPQPYRPELAQEDFVALGDQVVCVDVAAEERSAGGIIIAAGQRAPYAMVLHVGPKVSDVIGHPLAQGDLVIFGGGNRIETTAGSVSFVSAKEIKAIVLRRAPAEPEPEAA